MAPHLYNRLVRDTEYVNRVRRHTPSTLLPLVAAAAAKYAAVARPDAWLSSPHRVYTPWALADVARVAIAQGTEYNRQPATERDLLEILAAYAALADPAQLAPAGPSSLAQFLLRVTGAQLAWQKPEFHALARTAAIFIDTGMPPGKKVSNFAPGWDEDLFGCPLPEYVGTIQMLWAAAAVGHGVLAEDWFVSPEAQEIGQHLSLATVRKVIDRHLAVDVQDFKRLAADSRIRAAARAPLDPQGPRFTFNPLQSRPIIKDLSKDFLLIPNPQLMWHKASPAGIYFTGLEKVGGSFPAEVGTLFEQYVGRQLKLIPDAVVYPEVAYKEGKNTVLSVDWFVVLDDLVLMLEVKSTMPTEALRLGLEAGVEDVTDKIGKAHDQLETTHRAILQHRQEFGHIPTDRPVIGAAVTLEPFHLANSPFLAKALPATTIPVLTMSIHELEQLVTVTSTSISQLLLNRQANSAASTYSLSAVLAKETQSDNPILKAAWEHFPWGSRGTVRVSATTSGQAGQP